MKTSISMQRRFQIGILSGLLMLGAGCKKNQAPSAEQAAPVPAQPQPPNDQQISSAIQAKINSESALNGQNIQVAFANGVATLTGTVINDASRSLAAADGASVDGVRTVVNNLSVEPPKQANTEKPRREESARVKPSHKRMTAPPPPAETASAPPPPPPPPAQEAVNIVPPPPPPPPPVVKTVTLAAGTVIPIRMTDSLDSSVTTANSVFHGSLATDLIVDGMVAAPRGANVVGRVVDAKDAAHFAGSAKLSIELTKIFAQGQEISVVTDTYTKEGAGRGKNTAVKGAGGAALGAIIGALAGGGKGAAIGAATGGGIGAGSNGISRGQQVKIPSETLVNFKLQSPISVTTSKLAGGGSRNFDSDQGTSTPLQQRQ